MSSCSDPLVVLDNVTLRIPVDGLRSRSLKHALVGGLTGGLLRSNPYGNKVGVEVLRSFTLSIQRGERVALLGHNGAGKSSLLRLLCDIYSPSSGSIVRHGSIVPLINKSFWVDTDLNGYHAAKAHYLFNFNSLRGFDQYLEELVNFTELADFIHVPIRTYSDGMRTRLQFGLLTSFQHDALALDEGIGTGDQWFLCKARQRLSDFLGSVGTLILASHSTALLEQFCTRGLVIRHGDLLFDGSLEDALDFYHSDFHS